MKQSMKARRIMSDVCLVNDITVDTMQNVPSDAEMEANEVPSNPAST